MKSVFVFAVAALFATARRADFPVTDGSVICVGGDSILDWGNGAAYIETYLRLCAGQKNTSCFRDASGGTTMNYFKATMRDMMPFLRPTHFIMMYEVYRKLGEKLFKIRARESQALAATIRPVRHVIEVVPL